MFVIIVAGLYLGREVLIPVTLAVLLSFILAPLANLIERLRIGEVPSVFIAVALALGVILGIGGLIGTQLADLAQNAPRYQAEIQRKFGAVRGFLTHSISGLTGSIKPEN